jgi:hypothetical protein
VAAYREVDGYRRATAIGSKECLPPAEVIALEATATGLLDPDLGRLPGSPRGASVNARDLDWSAW